MATSQHTEVRKCVPASSPEENGATTAPEKPSATAVSSGISNCGIALVALSGFGSSCLPGALIGQQSIYISLFDGHPTIIGVFAVLVVIYTVLIGPAFGRLADEGFFNILCFRDRSFWGRRAPVTLLAIPVGMVGFFGNFVGPESLDSDIGVAFWFGAVNFIMATAWGGYNPASNSAVSELFPTERERVRVLMSRGSAQAFGGLLGAAVIGPIALSQDDKGSDKQRIIFLGLGIFTATMWTLLVPWAFLQRRTVVKKELQKQPSLLAACVECFRAVPAFRVFCIGEHGMGAVLALFLAALPFMFQHVMEFNSNQVSAATAIFIGTLAISAILGAPVAGWLTKCFQPANVLGAYCIAEGLLIPVAFASGYALRENFLQSILAMTVLAAICGGFTLAAFTLVRMVLITRMVDLDHVTRAKEAGYMPADSTESTAGGTSAVEKGGDIPARRDGLFQSIHGAFGFSGAAWAGLLPILLGALGYESSRDDANPPIPQPREVRVALFVVLCVIAPLLFISYAWVMLRFPLRGEALQRLADDYSALYASLEKSAASMSADGEGCSGKTAEKTPGLEAEKKATVATAAASPHSASPASAWVDKQPAGGSLPEEAAA
mmetsp:Transcript_10366/g.23408  ORF Transcript_10366/g.23408 Transcript_10366/m.23408 type:complete len:608 (-) Transcript_10366:184-2007(-)